MRRPPASILLLALALIACRAREDDRPVDISAIGRPLRGADSGRPPLDAPRALLADATAQGLVAFDAAGQIEPALAERWIVSDEGRSFIFRLGDARWPDGSPVRADQVAARLRAAVASGGRNPYAPILGAIDEIVAVTPQVIDIRLSSPRPNLLQLLAQPEFAMMRGTRGSGPMAAALRDGVATLSLPDPADPDAPRPAPVRLRGERVALAVARYRAGQADGVAGGTFADLPLARAAAPGPTELRFDPAPGLFGLVFTAAPGPRAFTADPAIRRTLAMAVDRDALVAAFAVPGWRTETRLIGGDVDDLAAIAAPDWAAAALPARRAEAAATIARWRAARGAPPVLAVALPPGPGSRLLLARLSADWGAIGVPVRAALRGETPDLTLIDAVAPGGIASWYLRRFACSTGVPCSASGDVALVAARVAPTLAERAVMLREADRIVTATVPFIALARPLRWSLVGQRLTGWRESPRALHPLRHIREVRR